MMSCSTRGCVHVQRVAAAGEVHVVAAVLGRQAVVGGVVDAAQRQRRAELVALGRVVVDDVEDHLDAGGVQAPDHHLELRAPTLRGDAWRGVVDGPGRRKPACCSPSSWSGRCSTRWRSST